MESSQAIRKNVKDSCQAQVESFLLGRIEAGVWNVGDKIPSERELAEELNLSRTTIRNAVLTLTSRGFFERSIGQGTFIRKKPEVRTPGRISTGTIGYIVCKEKASRQPLSLEAFYFDIFSGIEEATARAGFHTLFTYVDDFDREETASLQAFLRKTDGVIIEEAQNAEFLQAILDSGIPAVLLAPSAGIDGMDLVTMDLASGARKAVRKLVELGHERIGIVNGPLQFESARLRFEAWKEVLTGAGLSVDERLVARENTVWTAEAGSRSMVQLLDRNVGLTAVFCANDLLAIGALSALYERSLRVPDDVSVIGFDDTELSRHSSPPLTTMKIYSRDMARAAVRRLLERFEDPGLPAVKIEFPIDLIWRKSCKEVEKRKGDD